ncbi:MAG: hypothetical protein L6427_05280 [Actinomycetia bacterium]|nr:hypothetical protein [Actinomycetes bacterium]
MLFAAVELSTVALVTVAVLVWFGCAFYTAGIARNSGRSYHLWLLIGVLTGPPGLVFAYLLLELTGERSRRIRYGEGGKSDIAEMVRCPNCNQSVPRSFEHCQFCGAPLSRRKHR